MRKWKVKYTALLLAMILFLSIMQPLAPQASPATTDEAIQLEKGQPLNGSFSEPGEVQWYKIEPTEEEIQQDTHRKQLLTESKELVGSAKRTKGRFYSNRVSLYSNLT